RPPPPSPNWAKTDWTALTPILKSLDIPPPPSYPNDVTVDAWLDTHLTSLTTLLKAHTPLKRPTSRSKPWWSRELTHLRQNFHRAARVHRREHSPSSLSEARATRNTYLKAIKKAKAEHWKAFLSRVDSKTVWTAKRLAEGRDYDKFPSFPDASSPADLNSSLLDYFFPPKSPSISQAFLRTDPHALQLESEEISRALRKSSNTS